MGTSSVGEGAGIQNAIGDWQEAQEAYAGDVLYMHSFLKDIVGRQDPSGKKISTDTAYMMLICTFGQMVQVTGDRAARQSAAQAVGAACSSKMNEIVDAFNVLQDPSSSAAAINQASIDIVDGITTIQNVLQQNNQLPTNQQWIDSTTVTSINKALSSFSAMFGGGNGAPPSKEQLVKNIINWTSIVNSPDDDNGSTSRSAAVNDLQTALGHLNTVNSAFASSTSLQGNLLQNQFAQVTTMSNALRSLLQSLATFARTVSSNLGK